MKKVLIANRGEIAVRVIRACQDLNLQSVAIYSDADKNSRHVGLADEAYCVGPASSAESYLNIQKIIDTAKQCGADAVHPGYGFLSENANFAQTLQKEGIAFIGPTVQNLKDMGDKLSAREIMRTAGVPIVPGSPGEVKTLEDAEKITEEIGFPVIIKASAGGGGKGIRVVYKKEDLSLSFDQCRSEGKKYFSNEAVFIERFVQNPKHIEIQVFGDTQGNVVHFYERECSAQRRNQKILEESPSPSLTDEIREKMGVVSVKAAQAMSYVGAGTMEFIFDGINGEFFFMEMNTRLQVEHPVTEMVVGIDLCKEQLRVAQGEKLSFTQDQIQQQGHAIELRICAEDPWSFTPSPATIHKYQTPQGAFVRVDDCIYEGYEIPIHYDPMISKLIVWGSNRTECIQRLKRALREYILLGVKNNIPLHKQILKHPKFLSGEYTTQFIENEKFGPDADEKISMDQFLIAAAISAYEEHKGQNPTETNFEKNLWKQEARQSQLRH